jgi:hypothetical protein
MQRQQRITDMQKIVDWDPADGAAFQGDVAIISMPASIKISRVDEISPVDGCLILQEGELTGHNHAIVLDRPVPTKPRKTSKAAEKLMADTLAGRIEVPAARLYRDRAAVDAMVRMGVLTRADLAVGCLVVEGGPMVVTHQEHDGIRVPPGQYYVGRQVESAGAEERVVAD